MSLPYPPGSWFVGDRTPDGKGMVHQDLSLEGWFKSKGLQWTDSYGITVIGWSSTSKPWLVLVHRYATKKGKHTRGQFYRSRIWRHSAARRIPKPVRP